MIKKYFNLSTESGQKYADLIKEMQLLKEMLK